MVVPFKQNHYSSFPCIKNMHNFTLIEQKVPDKIEGHKGTPQFCVLNMKLQSHHPSGASNLDVSSIFIANSWITPSY